jgi:hypothetical protein
MDATLQNCVNQQQSSIAIWATAVRHHEVRRPEDGSTQTQFQAGP